MTDLVPITRTVVDDAEPLADALRAMHAAGRLVTAPDTIRATPTKGGKWWVRVQVLEPAPKPIRRQRLADFDRRHPILGPCLKALAFGLTVLSAVAFVLVAVGFAIARTIGWATVGAALFAVASLAAMLVALASSGHRGHDGWGFHWSKCK
jgi:hypothetical protein